jgi:2-dehydro-3-deoxygluconokinase
VTNLQLARQNMSELLPHVDLVVANEADAEDVLGIAASESNVEQGELNVASYESVAREIVRQFPNVRRVAITLRESLSADHNNWGAMLYDAQSGQASFAPLDSQGRYQPWEIRDIVDRVGAGDSFAAGLLFALDTPELAAPERAIQFAVAASCLKHSVEGDFNYVTRDEIESLMAGNASGRVQR